jgi:long-chain acyl-CoA synthetase
VKSMRRHIQVAMQRPAMNLARWILKNGRCAPDRPAISAGGCVHLTYGQWAARSGVLGASLRRLCRQDDRVAIGMTNNPFYLEVFFAIWHAGLLAVPMNAKLHSEEFRYIIEKSFPSILSYGKR